jgi:hypothetical protein
VRKGVGGYFSAVQTLALTFDDGPDRVGTLSGDTASWTPQVAAEYGLRLTGRTVDVHVRELAHRPAGSRLGTVRRAASSA